LPGNRPGTVLLEDYTLAVLPHGPFLLDQLTAPARKPQSSDALLVLGGVRYDDRPVPPSTAAPHDQLVQRSGAPTGDHLWDYLGGSERELKQVAALAQARTVRLLTGAEAGTDRVLEELPQARWAHLATHGFFADKSFRSVLQLDEQLFARRELMPGQIGERIGEGARSPLVLSGLVLAGANRKDVPDRGILTADAVVGLNLSGLELAVLSACETGLGEVAGGEGVFGLQRAFHLAGARNVVASLWKVDDEATAALMALFYHKLWREQKPPVEALREAQLTLYRHPERINTLARERGPVLEKVLKLPADRPAEANAPQPHGKAPVKVWAGFVFSGAGQ
jgi:CHAT domain-containing protein